MSSFKNIDVFQEAIRKHGKLPDYVKVGNVIYTMDNYDMSGKEVHYGNKKTGKGLLVETEDRYKKGLKDAIVSDSSGFLRNDISYLK